jgi:glutathione S-transferase
VNAKRGPGSRRAPRPVPRGGAIDETLLFAGRAQPRHADLAARSGIAAEFERVDLRTKVTQRGDDYRAINPAGSVPMLLLDDGSAITENVAVLDLLAQRAPQLGVEARSGALG